MTDFNTIYPNRGQKELVTDGSPAGKRRLSAKIERDIEAFIEAGGMISVLDAEPYIPSYKLAGIGRNEQLTVSYG